MILNHYYAQEKESPPGPGHPKRPEIEPSTPKPEQEPSRSPEVYPQKSLPEIEPKQPDREIFPGPSPQIFPGGIPPEFPD